MEVLGLQIPRSQTKFINKVYTKVGLAVTL